MAARDPIHELKNYLSIILGFSELLLAEMGESDIRRGDLMEIKQAADRALILMPELTTVRNETE